MADILIGMNKATDKLWKYADEWEKTPEHFDGVNPFCVAIHAVRQMTNAPELPNEQKHGHWISVNDRLPDKQPCEYLVVNANNVETAICLDNRWITPRRVIKITHWMPLPEPPEVKQDD